MPKNRVILVVAGVLAISALAAPQLKQILKLGGTVALVNTFGKDMNKGLNKLMNHEDTKNLVTKVVPILTVGVNRSSSVGAAQVMGPPDAIKKVVGVASPEAEFLGKEVRLRGLIPVSSKNVVEDIKKVDGVAVSGIIELKL